MNRLLGTFAGMAGALLAGSAAGAEKPIDKSAVPAPVMLAVSTKYPKGKVNQTVTETEKDRTLYEVRLSNGKEKVDLKIDETGKVVAEERPVAMKSVPKPVSGALAASEYKSWKVQRIEKIDNLEAPDSSGYEVIVEKKGKGKELLYSGEGKLLEEEDEDDLHK